MSLPKRRLLIVEDRQLVGEGFASMLRQSEALEVLGVVNSGDDCLAMLAATPADLVVLDHQMPGKNGLQTFEEIHSRWPETAVVVITFLAQASILRTYLRKEVRGLMLKSDSASELLFGMEQVARGNHFISSGVSLLLNGHGCSDELASSVEGIERLTPTELEVLAFIGRGMTTAEISQERHTSEKTVRRQKQNIMDKLTVHREAKLVRLAIEAGLA